MKSQRHFLFIQLIKSACNIKFSYIYIWIWSSGFPIRNTETIFLLVYRIRSCEWEWCCPMATEKNRICEVSIVHFAHRAHINNSFQGVDMVSCFLLSVPFMLAPSFVWKTTCKRYDTHIQIDVCTRVLSISVGRAFLLE